MPSWPAKPKYLLNASALELGGVTNLNQLHIFPRDQHDAILDTKSMGLCHLVHCQISTVVRILHFEL